MKRQSNLSQTLTLLIALLLATTTAHALDFGEWTSNAKQAKTLASQTGRPIFAVMNAIFCAHCENLRTKALETDEFKAFARKNQIVLFTSDDSTLSLSNAVVRDYANICQYGSLAPHIFLFHVKSTANLNDSSSNAFSESEVDLVQVIWSTSENKYCGKQFMSDGNIFGVNLGNEANWNPTILGNVLAKFFPNNYWSSQLQYPDITNIDDENPNYNPDDDPDNPDDPITPDPTPWSGDWQDLDKWDGIWLTDIAKAKKYAYENNRPLFAVMNSILCSHCENLRSKALETDEFRQFASENKLILYQSSDASVSLSNRVVSNYSHLCLYGSLSPHIFLFKVKDGANLTSTAASALDSDQVELVQVTWSTSENKYCGKQFMADSSIFGISIGEESNWNATTLGNVIKKFFPNTGWETLTPQATGPSGYEDAVALPRIPNQSNPPETSGYSDKWYSYASNINLAKGTSVQTWFTFQGDGGKRYWFNTHVLPTAAAGTGTYSMTAEIYSSSGNKPATSPLYTLQSSNLDTFSKGFAFDAPSNSGTGKTFFLRLAGTSSSSSSKLPVFDLQVHETISSPASGTVTNPRWTGATKGLWTMDLDKAKELAYKTNTPLLLYFVGVAWCPHCINMEHNTFNQSAFTSALSNYYAVVLDNQRRSPSGDTAYPGYGPSLLVDNSPLGYLKANSISESDGQAKLQANLNVQKSLIVPGKNRVGYPTLVLCRVTKQGNDYNLDPIGRFGEDDGDTASKAVATLQKLTTLYQAGYSESSAYQETSEIELDTSGEVQTTIPVSDTLVTWLKFTLLQGETLEVIGSTTNATQGATIAYSVYDMDGILLDTSEKQNLTQETSYRFTYPENEAKDLWLKVTVEGQQDIATLTLTAKTSLIISELILPNTPVFVNRRETTVEVPISLLVHHPEYAEDEPISFYYRVMPADATQSVTPAPARFFDGTGWTQFFWDDLTQNTVSIPVGIHVPASEENWDDMQDFVIAFKEDGLGLCTIPENAFTKVSITAYPMFLDCQTDFTLYTGLNTVLDFPICPSDYMTITARNLPTGLSFVNNSEDHDNPRLTIKGTPTVEGTKKATLSIIYNNGTDLVPLSLPVTIKVISIDNDLIFKTAFAGVLRSSLETGIAGSLVMTRNAENEMVATIITGESTEPQTAIIGLWEYDSATNALTTNAVFDDGATLNVTLSDTIQTAVFISSRGTQYHCQALAPVTETPSQYVGVYNIALRQSYDISGHSSEGWIHMKVDNAGVATMKIMTYATGVVQEFTTCVTDGANGGTALFYLPYFVQNDCVGKVYGLMNITPKSERTSEALSWISDCSDSESIFIYGGEQISLKVCGTVFDKSKSISDCVGQTTCVFVAETPDLDKAIVAPLATMEETSKFIFTPVTNDSILFPPEWQITVNEEDGTFTLPAFALKRGKNQALLTQVPIEIKGIFVPTSLDCCGADDNVAIAYGYYRYPAEDGDIYHVCLKAVYPNMPMPPPQLALDMIDTDANLIYAYYDIIADSDDDLTDQAIVICHSDTRYYAFTNGMILLPGNGDWQVTSLHTGKTYAESAAVALGGITTLAYGTTGQEGESHLKQGWNLIGIPFGLTIPADASLLDKDGNPVSLMMHDPASASYVSTTTVQSGKAYWLFVRSDDTFSLTALDSASLASMPKLPRGWSMSAYSPLLDASVIYKYINGKFIQVQQGDTNLNDTKGVMVYKE